MLAGFLADVVNADQRCAGQLKLAAGLQRHGSAVARQGNQLIVLIDALPAETHQALEHGLDAVVAGVIWAAQRIEMEGEFLVFGADAPLVTRLAARLEIADQLGK